MASKITRDPTSPPFKRAVQGMYMCADGRLAKRLDAEGKRP